jgi:nitroimidazol reductase NimA-like FMN-containing flavoprotein (pyridoxamine 5'-phosphate oxidase superfamily)
MTDDHPTTLGTSERDQRLENGGVGVLSITDPDSQAPHAVPVSYGYDAETTVFYFRLATGPDSHKTDLADRAVTFVTYGTDDDDRWWSVVASGRLEPVDAPDIATETLEGLERVRIPLVDIFGTPPKEVTFAFVRLLPEELTGRKEAPTAV